MDEDNGIAKVYLENLGGGRLRLGKLKVQYFQGKEWLQVASRKVKDRDDLYELYIRIKRELLSTGESYALIEIPTNSFAKKNYIKKILVRASKIVDDNGNELLYDLNSVKISIYDKQGFDSNENIEPLERLILKSPTDGKFYFNFKNRYKKDREYIVIAEGRSGDTEYLGYSPVSRNCKTPIDGNNYEEVELRFRLTKLR